MSLYKLQICKDRCRSSGEPLTHGLTCHGHPNEPLSSPIFLFTLWKPLHILDVVLLGYSFTGSPYSLVVCS
jgi:hypothetical protein